MFERFCPNIHGICRDGHADHSEHLCVYWDSLGEVCNMAQSMQLTSDGYKLTNQMLQQKIELGQDLARKAQEGELKFREGKMEIGEPEVTE